MGLGCCSHLSSCARGPLSTMRCAGCRQEPKVVGRPAGFPPDAPLQHQPACKPGSVWPAGEPADVTAIPLVRRLPGASSNQPERLIWTDPAPKGRAVPIRFCSRWGLPCRCRRRQRGALLPHRFTLAPAVTQRAVAVSSLWHCPWGRPKPAPAGRYPAPLVHGARTFLSGRLSALARSGRPAD